MVEGEHMNSKDAAIACLQSMIDRLNEGAIRVCAIDYSRPAVEVPLSADETWKRFEPSRFTTVTITYENAPE